MGKIQKIVSAISEIDLINKDLVTGDGAPKVDVLEEATGEEITAAERDEAWQIYQTQLESLPATIESTLPDLTGASHVVTMESSAAVTKWYRDGKLIHVGPKPDAADE